MPLSPSLRTERLRGPWEHQPCPFYLVVVLVHQSTACTAEPTRCPRKRKTDFIIGRKSGFVYGCEFSRQHSPNLVFDKPEIQTMACFTELVVSWDYPDSSRAIDHAYSFHARRVRHYATFALPSAFAV